MHRGVYATMICLHKMRHLQYLNERCLVGTDIVRFGDELANQSLHAIRCTLRLQYKSPKSMLVELIKVHRWDAVDVVLTIRPPKQIPPEALRYTIERNHRIALRLARHYHDSIDERVLEAAAASRNLQLLKAVRKHRSPMKIGPYIKAMNCPYMLDYLLDRRVNESIWSTGEIPSETMEYAIRTGNPEIVKVVKKYTDPTIMDAYEAGYVGNLDIVHLVSNGDDHNMICSGASLGGHVDVIRHYNASNYNEQLHNAAWNGHVNVIDYLSDHLDHVIAYSMLKDASEAGQLNVIKRLAGYIPRNHTLLNHATDCSQEEVVKYLVENHPVDNVDIAVENARRNYNTDILRHLVKLGINDTITIKVRIPPENIEQVLNLVW